MKFCVNHPNKKAFSICHSCGKDYCEECLDEGKEYYYCKSPECQKLLSKESPPALFPVKIICPNCSSEIELEDDERTSRKVHCPECEAFFNLKAIPPEVLKKESYVELFSSLNQGDIALIQSILDDSEIDYYVLGENFLSARPLLEPARFFVNENQLVEAKELLKNFELHIWGTSNKK